MPVPIPTVLGHAGRSRRARARGSRRRHAAGAPRRRDAGRARGALPAGGRAHRHAAAARRRARRRRDYLPYGIAFDVEKLTWELDFFIKHFLEAYRGVVHRRRPRATALRAEFAALVDELAAEPRVLCHRDYHSRNLMLHDDRLYIIDFQDARMGPDTYDLVSLLRDSYVDLPEQTVDELIAYFLALKGQTGQRARVPAALRPDGAAAQPEGARHVRLPDDRAAQPGLHPVHPAHAALRPRQPRTPAAVRPAARAARRRTSRSSGRSRAARGPHGSRQSARWSRVVQCEVPSCIGTSEQSMRFGISTHLYHDRRLEREHLAQIAGYGFEAIELFATRSHFDYHDDAAIARLRRVAGGNRAGAAQRPRADHRRASAAGDRGDDLLERGDRQRPSAQAAVREAEAALQIARRDSVRRPRRAPRNAGGMQTSGRQQPRGGGSQPRGDLPRWPSRSASASRSR